MLNCFFTMKGMKRMKEKAIIELSHWVNAKASFLAIVVNLIIFKFFMSFMVINATKKGVSHGI